MDFSQALKTYYLSQQKSYRRFIWKQRNNLLRRLAKLLGQYSSVGDKAFFDPHQFNWITDLEADWEIIRAELDQLLEHVKYIPNFQDISRHQYEITQDNLWKTYFLYAYGYKAHQSCAKCPKTTELIERIPGLTTAFFSILLPHKVIPEHVGMYKGLLRYHLALKVPMESQRCGIRVGREHRTWEEGKSLVFDDTFPHAAWNRTNEIRVVLFVDFVRPMRFPFCLLNRFMIWLIAKSPLVQEGKRNWLDWEPHFETFMSDKKVEDVNI